MSLGQWPVTIELPVQWGDMDAFQHVNNVVYLRWFESARIEYADRMGLSAMMAAHRIGPILAAVKCNYRRPVTHDEVEMLRAAYVSADPTMRGVIQRMAQISVSNPDGIPTRKYSP